jgi:hypothetical protein
MDGTTNCLPPVAALRAHALQRSSIVRDNAATASWREATIVFIIFTIAQVADGLLTYWGVTTLGIHVEGNGLLAASMHAIGPFRALVSAKLLACVCGYVLYHTASHKPLAVMAGLYIGVAIAPWMLVLGGLFQY